MMATQPKHDCSINGSNICQFPHPPDFVQCSALQKVTRDAPIDPKITNLLHLLISLFSQLNLTKKAIKLTFFNIYSRVFHVDDRTIYFICPRLTASWSTTALYATNKFESLTNLIFVLSFFLI